MKAAEVSRRESLKRSGGMDDRHGRWPCPGASCIPGRCPAESYERGMASGADTLTFEGLPQRIEDESALEELLSRPTRALVDDLARLEGDIIVLGVAGKIGPTIARMAKRAAPSKRVVGVARFSSPQLKQRLESWGIETLTCDLMDRAAVGRLPQLPNVVYMAGRSSAPTPIGPSPGP